MEIFDFHYLKKGGPWILLLSLIIFIILLFHVAHYLIIAKIVLTFPYGIDYGESLSLYEVKLILSGNLPYQSLEFQFLVCPYPPLYFFLCALISYITTPTFLIGRLVSFIAFILISLVVYKIINTLTKSLLLSLLCSLALYVPLYIKSWSLFYRVETLALLFVVLGIYVRLHGKNRLGYFLYLLAFLTKQIFISIVIADMLFVIIKSQNKKKYIYDLIMFFIIPFTIFTCILGYITNYNYINYVYVYEFFFFYYSIEVAFEKILFFVRQVFLFLVLSFISIIIKLRENKELSLIDFYFIITLLFISSIGKAGASTYYFMEPYIALCMEVFSSLSMIYNKMVKYFVKDLSIIILMIILIMQILTIHLCPRIPMLSVTSYDEVYNLVNNSEGLILSEDNSFPVLANKGIVADFFILTQLALHNKWDEKPLLRMIRNRSFSLIILEFDVEEYSFDAYYSRFTPSMILEIKNNYRLYTKTRYFYVYVPKNSTLDEATTACSTTKT